MVGTNQGSTNVKAGYFWVPGGVQTLFTGLPLPSAATYASAVDGSQTDVEDIVGYSNGDGQIAVGSMRWPYNNGFPTFDKIITNSRWDGKALRINPGSRAVGYYETLDGDQGPYMQIGTGSIGTALGLGGYSQGQAQVISSTDRAIAGWLNNSGGSGYLALWTRPSNQAPFVLVTPLITIAQTGYATAVFNGGGGMDATVYGWLSTDARPFRYSELTGVLTPLGKNGEMTSVMQSQMGFAAGTNGAGLPCLFIESDDPLAGTGIADDLNAFLRPGEPEPRAQSTLVTGINGTGTFGGVDFGPNSTDENIWTTTIDHSWLTSTYQSANITSGKLSTGSNLLWSEGPDGKAAKIEKFIQPNPSTVIEVNFTHDMGIKDPPLDLTFRATARLNTSGFVMRLALKNWLTGNFDEAPTIYPIGTHMKTGDLTTTELSKYVLNHSQTGPWKAQGRIRIVQVAPGTSQPVLEVEQARFLAKDN